MGEFKCPVAECTYEPFGTLAGLKSHLRIKHPDFTLEEEEEREVPIIEEDFATLLKQFRIKAGLAAYIAKNVSHTGGSKVFEKPELLFKRLTAWSSDIPPGMRKNIIEQWFAEKGIDISPEVQQKAGMTTEQINRAEAETTGRYIFDEKAHTIRMAKEGERGGH